MSSLVRCGEYLAIEDVVPRLGDPVEDEDEGGEKKQIAIAKDQREAARAAQRFGRGRGGSLARAVFLALMGQVREQQGEKEERRGRRASDERDR